MQLLDTYSLTIQERHLDVFGHVNNTSYLEIYEEGRWNLMAKNHYGLQNIRQDQKGPIVLNLNLSFRAELLVRENIKLEIYFVGMKNKLIMNFHQKILKEDATVSSYIDVELAIMDLVQRKLVVPPASWWKAIGLD